jgi:hypothetical protein
LVLLTSEDIDVTAIKENKWVSELFHKQIFDYVKSELSKDKYFSVCLRRVW